MNRDIRKLYERNYTTPTTDPMRKWTSPFYIPSEQSLLKSILAKKLNRPTTSFITPTRFDSGTGADDDDGGSVMSSSSLGSLSDDGSSIMTDVSSSEGEEKEEEVEDPSISKESDYYQNEVYKQ